MPVHLGWRPTTVPTVSGSSPALAGGRRDFGLEITGNDAAVADGDEGRIKIMEVAGTGSNKGASESSSDRLICTFHGTWHRSGKGSAAKMTFEVFVPSGSTVNDWTVHGYDPECMPGLGVDGFALTFLGRVFPVNFPFFIDSVTEGRFLELQAIAESGPAASAKTLVKSPVLNVPIRRKHKVTSTNNNNTQPYTDNLCGNWILHHESYLIQSVRVAHGASFGTTAAAGEFFAIVPSTSGAFASYPQLSADRKLRVFIQPGVADAILPAATEKLWTHKPLSGLGAGLRATLLAKVRQALLDTFTDIFIRDAGFTDGHVAFLDAAPSSDAAIVASLRGSRPVTIPFFTFLIEQNDSLNPEVAHSEETTFSTTPSTMGGFDWLVQSPFPQGSGDKVMQRGVQFRADYFSEYFEKAVTRQRAKGEPALTAAEAQSIAEKQAAKVAETVSHEVAHSLGMMHESEVAATFDENGVGPLRSIMCSMTDSQPFGMGVRFSNQAKIIWRGAFGTSPQLPTDSLRNKTWTDAEVKTVDWMERMNRFMHIIGEDSIARHPPDQGQVSPYTTMPSTQPGTYVPPSE